MKVEMDVLVPVRNNPYALCGRKATLNERMTRADHHHGLDESLPSLGR